MAKVDECNNVGVAIALIGEALPLMKRMRLGTAISIFAMVMGLSSGAQEHPFLSRFELVEGDGWVSVEWTMKAGNMCDGTMVLRSLDGLVFEPVTMIAGICGNITEPVNYQALDDDPPELRSLYYRLDLGTNGSSEVKRIDLQRLTSQQHRFQPSPASGEGLLLLRVPPEQQVEVLISSSIGQEVHRSTGMGGSHRIDLGGWSSGQYIYHVFSKEGSIATGRLMVE